MRLAAKGTETENLFEILANKSPVGLYIVQDGKFCYTNPTFQRTTGYREDELLGRNSLGLVVPEDREQVRENAIKMLKRELTLPYQFRVIHKTGSIRWIMESVVSIQYRGRRATLGDFVDITERKQAEEAWREAEEEKSALLEEAPVAIISADLKGKITYANKRFESESGYSREEIVGKNGFQLDWLPVGTMKYLAKRMAARLRGGPGKHWETQFKCKDGRWIWIEIEGKVLRKLGVPVGFQIIARNTTARKQAEETLQAERNKLQSLIDAIEDTITIQDTEYNIIYQNEQSRIASGGDHVGEKCYRAYEGRETVCDGCPVEEAFKDSKSHTTERRTAISGKVAFWENTANPIRDARGRVVSCLELARDITKRKQIEEAIQAERNKLQSLIDAMEDSLTIQDTEYNIVYQNEVSKKIFGDRLGEKCYRAYEGRETVCDECPVEQTFKDGKSHTTERKTVLPSGEVIIWENTANPIRDAKGMIVSCLELGRNITKRKKAEKELSKTQAQLSSAVQIAHLGPWEYDAINDLFIFNDAFYELFHTTADEVGGYTMPSAEYTRRFVYPEDAHLVGEEVRKALQADDPNFSRQLDHRIIYADGEVGYISVRFFIVKDETGRTVRTYGVNQDITERKKAEQAIQVEKNKLQSLIDAMTDALTIQDTEYNILFQNEPSRKSTGGDRIGEKCYRAYEGRETVCDGCPVEKAFKDGKPRTMERQRVMSGELSFWENTANPIRDAGGRIVACLEIGRNITERKKQEQALADELTQHRLLIDKSLDGIVVLDVDARVVEANQRFADMLGYTMEEVRELHTWDWDKQFPPEKILEMGRAVDEKGLHLETKHTRKDGSVIDVDISISGIMYGGRKLIFCIQRDITERNRTEEALKDSEESYRKLADSITDVFFAMDEHLRYTYWNKASEILTGVRTEDALGKSLQEIFPDTPDLGRAEKVYRKVLKTQQAQTFVNDFDIDGRHHIFEISAYPSRGGISVFVRDITERKHSEEALRQSEERFRSIVENSQAGIMILDDAFRFTYVNDELCRMSGYSPQEIIGQDFRQFLDEESLQRVADRYIRRQRGEEVPPRYEFNFIHKDGQKRRVEISSSVIKDSARKVKTVAQLLDITERKQAEEALNLQRAYFQQLFDNSPDAIIMTDPNNRTIQVNRGFEVLFGYSNEEAKGRLLEELIIPEEDTQEASNSFQRILGGEVVRKERVRRRKDGSLVDVSILAYPICLNDKPVGLYAIYSDITERKQAEEAIKQAAEEWRKTFDSISDAVSIHDRDFRVLRVNKAFAVMFHKKLHQVIGKHCYELHKVEKPHSGCPHQQTLATGKPAMAEFYESHLEKYLRESTSPIFNEQGEVVGTVHITRDITEQKQQNERLMMTDRLASIGELAAGTAHELNNPLTSVIGFSQLLMEKDIPDDIREDVKLIYNEAQRAADVTKNLLTFARKHALVKQLTQINNIIVDVLKLRAYEHKVNSIQVKRRLAHDLPEIMVDYFQMQQVFLNIIINAEYFMTEAHNRGTLTITTKKHDSSLRISFTDDGPGIPEENLSRIFDPFFTTKEAGKGTGLGLSICHGIVAEHGGQIYAKSQPGKGATFVVELPIKSP
jgi:PAS domain S-box-containing protein